MARNLLRRFDTIDDYNDEKCTLEVYTISHINEDKLTKYGTKPSYFTATYNVTSTSSSTSLLGFSSTNMQQISKMYIDDVEVTPTKTYTFNTNGEHTIKCEFCKLTNCSDMFKLVVNLTSIDLTPLDTSNVTDMNNMFHYCSSLTSLDLTPLDTSNVTSMDSMFSSCSNLTSLDLTPLDTSKVTNMSYMFSSCSSLTSLIIKSDISKVTSYSNMFYNITTSGTLTYNCDYEDAWNNILVTNQSTSLFPSTWIKTCNGSHGGSTVV